MARYTLTMMHGNREAEGVHSFEEADDLLIHSPVTVMRAAMKQIDETAHVGHIEYHLFSCLKHDKTGIVTALGDLLFEHGDPQPFTAFVSKD